MPRAKVPSVFERRQAEKKAPEDIAADVAETSFRPLARALAIPIERLAPSPDNPRTETLDENLREFAGSIAERGILQPLAVRRDPERAGYYYVVAGSRRLLAAQIVRMSERAEERTRVAEIPCVVREGATEEIFADALVENLARQDLSRSETMQALGRLRRDYGWAVRDIARRTGRSAGDISEMLNVAQDVDLAPYVADETISPSAAVQIRRLPPALRSAALDGVRTGAVRKVKDVQRLRTESARSDSLPATHDDPQVFVNEHPGPPDDPQVFVNEQFGPPHAAAERTVQVAAHERRSAGGRRGPAAYHPDDATVERLAHDVLSFLARDPIVSTAQAVVLEEAHEALHTYLGQRETRP